MTAAVAAGLCLALSFPRADLGGLAWIALVPLFLSTNGCGWKRAFRIGWAAGAVFFGITLYWIPVTIGTYTNLSVPVSLGPYLLLVAVMACYVGLFAGGCALAAKRGWSLALAAPALWVAQEWLRGVVLGGFPWAGLGYTQHGFRLLMQVAELTGYYGISALVVLGNVAIAEAIMRRPLGWWPRLRPVLCATLWFFAAIGFGHWRLSELRVLQPDREIKVGIIQGNVDQFHKWDPAYQRTTIDRYLGLTRRARELGATLVVWPETAVPFYFQEDGPMREEILSLAATSGIYLLLGSPAFEYLPEARGVAQFNRAYLVGPQARIIGWYDKLRLVPFGEYVPLQPLLFFVDKVVEGVGNFAAGPEPVVFRVPGAAFGVLICYEGIFPSLARELVGGAGSIERLLAGLGLGREPRRAPRADFLVNITNDAWFGDTAAPHQHLIMASVRAIENRVPMVRVANTGISAIVEQDGRVRWRSRLFKPVVHVDAIRWRRMSTFYARFGDVFAYLEVALAVAMLIFPRRRFAGLHVG